MLTTLLFDFSRTLLFPKDNAYTGKLNDLYRPIASSKDYKFFDYFSLNNDLLNYLKLLKNKYTLAIYTTEIIQNDPAIKPQLEELFSFIFSAKDLGTTKKDSEGYLAIAKVLKLKPENILFIDDTLGNLEAASQAGLKTIQFISNKQLFKELEKIL